MVTLASKDSSNFAAENASQQKHLPLGILRWLHACGVINTHAYSRTKEVKAAIPAIPPFITSNQTHLCDTISREPAGAIKRFVRRWPERPIELSLEGLMANAHADTRAMAFIKACTRIDYNSLVQKCRALLWRIIDPRESIERVIASHYRGRSWDDSTERDLLNDIINRRGY